MKQTLSPNVHGHSWNWQYYCVIKQTLSPNARGHRWQWQYQCVKKHTLRPYLRQPTQLILVDIGGSLRHKLQALSPDLQERTCLTLVSIKTRGNRHNDVASCHTLSPLTPFEKNYSFSSQIINKLRCVSGTRHDHYWNNWQSSRWLRNRHGDVTSCYVSPPLNACGKHIIPLPGNLSSKQWNTLSHFPCPTQVHHVPHPTTAEWCSCSKSESIPRTTQWTKIKLPVPRPGTLTKRTEG